MPKAYLGDSVYVDFDSACGALILTTENGMGPSNTIVLEGEVYAALEKYVENLKEDLTQKRAEEAARLAEEERLLGEL